MSNRASVSTRNTRLATDFGEDLARKWFGDEAFDSIETKYVRGQNKGKLKGEVAWVKVDQGGWVSEGFDNGFVTSPGMKCAVLLDGYGDIISRKRFDPEGNGVLYFDYKLRQHVEGQCFRFGKMEK
jgi:hypothetical protein